MTRDVNRRTFVGTATVTAVGLLAGCGGSDGTEESDDGDEEMDTPTESSGGGEVSAEVEEYLSDAGNFEGTVQDETGTGSVDVEVGAEGNGGAFAFAPAAIRVDTGTEVTWTWTGEGGQHNVLEEDGAFESELVDEEGHEFQHTFEEAGTYLYACTPHSSLGMKGAVIVE